jgi:multidrug efflux pump subunit AcrA (membrane-fusion protein)
MVDFHGILEGMKNKLKNAFKNKYLVGGVLLILIIALYFGFKGNGGDTDSVTLSKADFVKTTSVSGKVVAAQSVDLSFETGGTVASVSKKVGDRVGAGQIIASLSAGDVLASREKAEADLLAAKAELSKLRNAGSLDSQTDADKQKLINSIIDGYTKSDDAIRNKVDQFFRDTNLAYPKIAYSFYDSVNKQGELNASRAEIEKTLNRFQALVSNLNVNTYSSSSLSNAKVYLQEVKVFLERLAPAVNTFEVGGNLTQTTADKYKGDLATARFNVNGAIESITSSESDLQGSVADISVQEARVSAAEANVRSYDAELAKMRIVAPFAGIVSKQDAKVGQAVAGNINVAALISQTLEVEIYIPEISLPGIALGNKARVILDAYPEESYEASIIHIDPAETIKDGVSNYKVRLSLVATDSKIVSGLTADVFIETEKKENVLSLPVRSTVTLEEKTYVYKKVDKDYVKTEVVLGSKDGKGSVEVVSGVSEGDTILLNPPQD